MSNLTSAALAAVALAAVATAAQAQSAAKPAKASLPPPAKEGWDSMAKKQPAKPASNEEIISLEDKDFGRY